MKNKTTADYLFYAMLTAVVMLILYISVYLPLVTGKSHHGGGHQQNPSVHQTVH
ncbi:MAG: hypothetical protein ACR2FM_00965 [Candidatus Saccharimonadales bacterium]